MLLCPGGLTLGWDRVATDASSGDMIKGGQRYVYRNQKQIQKQSPAVLCAEYLRYLGRDRVADLKPLQQHCFCPLLQDL